VRDKIFDAALKLGEKAIDQVASGAGGVVGLGAILRDEKGWDPVVPPDLESARLPPVAADGTVECWGCGHRFAFADVGIVDQGYACRTCTAGHALAIARASAPADVDGVSLRSKSAWLLPLAGLGFVAFVVIGIALYL
jgi:hypothetical protein